MTPNPSCAARLNDPPDLDLAPPARPATVRRLRLVEPVQRSVPPLRWRSEPGRPRSGARRVLHPHPLASLEQYRSAGGLRGLRVANEMTPAEIAATVLDSGLRGRGGAGFPTGRKWQTVADNAAAGGPATVVVNGAEGEPGTFKDRSILRHNPYQVIEGALIPRVVPPYLVGLLGEDPHSRVGAGPALVNNLETVANVPEILASGARWFRSVGTSDSPGTVVCTVTGDLHRHGVGEVPMGTPLRHVLDTIGGGPVAAVKAVVSGVANPVILTDQLDVPLSHEGMRSAGCGLGSAGFIVFAHPTDMVAVAAGVARFLSVESCGQCTPCKTDGLELATLLARLARSNATTTDLEVIEKRIGTVDYGARCYLAAQQETVLASIFTRFRDEFDAHLTDHAPPTEPVLIAELLDIRDGTAVIDKHHRDKQPDWSYGGRSSGSTPVELRSRYRQTPTR